MGNTAADGVSSISTSPWSAWKRYRVYALLLFVVSVWGGSFVAARMILYAGSPGGAILSPTMLATVRFSIASAIFLPILARQHLRVQPLKLADIPTFLLLGQLGISIYFWLQYTGVQLTNAGISAVLVVGLIPLATMVISGFTRREPLRGKRALALALGALGVAVVVSQRGLQVALESGFLFGSLCLIANAFAFALYSVLIRGIRARYPALTTTAAFMIGGTLGLLLLSVFTEDWSSVALLSAGQWMSIAYLAVVCSVLAYFLYNWALTQIEATKASVWIYLEPVAAVILGATMLGETITVHTLIGGIVILGSLVLTHRS
ncbi:MAG: DMT family transporter [Sphingomonadaceae bacterium]